MASRLRLYFNINDLITAQAFCIYLKITLTEAILHFCIDDKSMFGRVRVHVVGARVREILDLSCQEVYIAVYHLRCAFGFVKVTV